MYAMMEDADCIVGINASLARAAEEVEDDRKEVEENERGIEEEKNQEENQKQNQRKRMVKAKRSKKEESSA